ncbi:unnamed protein product [Notodromas monacha]|uniref:Uncharacterized protein n=1 Tax=Notodromas monacha TaxID=399045 RepID=A0A7R9BST4_9CRUS|nr:unnamed protein product [Notodromas monacha]CAG0921082.1 unnamed protein product [Notodromas monacha]
MPGCPVLGPKLSLCCLLVSVWGTLQLCLMGVFFYVHSVGLLEDLPVAEEIKRGMLKEYLEEVDYLYSKGAQNCWIAACLYVFSMVFSIWQFLANRRLAERIEQ